MSEARLVAVARREPVGGWLDPRNRPWVHDGERWRRPDLFEVTQTVEASDLTANGISHPVPTERYMDVEMHVGSDLKRYQGPVNVTMETRPRVIVAVVVARPAGSS